MKKIIYLLGLLSVISLSSCNSYLEQENPNKITKETFFKTSDDFDQALAAAYTPLRNTNGGYYNVRALELRNYRGDDVSVRNDTETLYQIHLFINSPDNKTSESLFNELYSGIYRANMILEEIANSDLSTDYKNEISGEAYFLRGINYFFLTKEYKDVPLRLTASQSAEDYAIAKSSQTEIYAQIEKDLSKAVELLSVEPVFNGRATKGAALAYLGKMYIYAEQWEKAIATLEPLTSSPYAYALTSNYHDNFDLDHEFNSESIFEVAYQKVGAGTDRWGSESSTTMMTTPMNRIYGCGDVGGWDICNGSPKALTLFTQENDQAGNTDPRVLSEAAWNYPGCIYYLKPFTEVVSESNINKIYVRKYSYCDYSEKEIVPESEINIRAYRYANVLLYLAEAYHNTGNDVKAISYLNQIRRRADLNELATSVSGEAVMNDIIHQRAIEFFCEGERFYDLRRWGLLEQEIKNSSDIRASNYQTKYDYLPIPSQEIQTNNLCEQSAGW